MPDTANKPQRQLINLRKRQQFLYIGIFTLVAVVVWVVGSIISSQRKTGISAELQKMAVPLNPNIDSLTIGRLEEKRVFTSEELQSFPIYKMPTVERRVSSDSDDQTPVGLPLEPTTDASEDESPSEEEVTTPTPSPSINPAQLDFPSTPPPGVVF